MYGGPPDPYRRPRPPMDPYGRGGYGGYGGGLFGSSGDCEGISLLPGLTVLALFIGKRNEQRTLVKFCTLQ